MSCHHIGGVRRHILVHRVLGQQLQPVRLVQAFKITLASSHVISTWAATRSAAYNVIGMAEALARSDSGVG
jgi:hypothetical protein